MRKPSNKPARTIQNHQAGGRDQYHSVKANGRRNKQVKARKARVNSRELRRARTGLDRAVQSALKKPAAMAIASQITISLSPNRQKTRLVHSKFSKGSKDSMDDIR
jgi:hypothetical protein